MAILTISNGKYGNEYIVIKKGEVWEIDKYTMEHENSYAIRIANSSIFQTFQSRYPSAGKGSIRLFLSQKKEEESKEWLVFYKKHKTVFPIILDDSDFMDYYFSNGGKYLTTYEVSHSYDFPDRLGVYMLSLCEALKKRDQVSLGCVDGGPLYYGFMRDILYHYISYSNVHQNVKTIDQLYAECSKKFDNQLDFLSEDYWDSPSFSSKEEPSLEFPIPDEEMEDPDLALYYAMDNKEFRYSKLQEFLSNPHFERYYGDVFGDGYLFILGNPITECEQQEIYEAWYQYGENGFDGIVVCPELSKNTRFLGEFEKASVTFFCVFESDSNLEKTISLSLLHKSEVIICLYDSTLYSKYVKNYPQATIVLPKNVEPDRLLDQADSFMISCYNRAKEKGYHV